MFSTESKFQKSFENNWQQESTPQSLRSLVGMILGGSNIQSQTNNSFEIQAIFSVAQCIFYNSNVIATSNSNIPQHHERESYLFQYMWDWCYMVNPANVAWLINSTTLDYQYHMTEFCWSGKWYIRALQIRGCSMSSSTPTWTFYNSCIIYDNIDHNSSSNTALGALHGTAISLFQHPCHTNPGEARIIESHVSSSHQEKRHFQKSTQMFHHRFCPRKKPKFHRLIVL